MFNVSNLVYLVGKAYVMGYPNIKSMLLLLYFQAWPYVDELS